MSQLMRCVHGRDDGPAARAGPVFIAPNVKLLQALRGRELGSGQPWSGAGEPAPRGSGSLAEDPRCTSRTVPRRGHERVPGLRRRGGRGALCIEHKIEPPAEYKGNGLRGHRLRPHASSAVRGDRSAGEEQGRGRDLRAGMSSTTTSNAARRPSATPTTRRSTPGDRSATSNAANRTPSGQHVKGLMPGVLKLAPDSWWAGAKRGSLRRASPCDSAARYEASPSARGVSRRGSAAVSGPVSTGADWTMKSIASGVIGGDGSRCERPRRQLHQAGGAWRMNRLRPEICSASRITVVHRQRFRSATLERGVLHGRDLERVGDELADVVDEDPGPRAACRCRSAARTAATERGPGSD